MNTNLLRNSFLKNTIPFNRAIRLTALSIAVMLALSATAQTSLPRSTAAEQGIDPRAVISLVDSLQALPDTEIHHLMVVRNGYVVAEGHSAPFKAGEVHTLFSCSKTITSLAVGIAIDENRLRLNDRMATFFPELMSDTISEGLASLTVRHLLTMDAGAKMTTDMRKMGDSWENYFLAVPGLGTDHRFRYNSFCTYMLSAIVQRVTGQRLVDYLGSRLFQPLGITRYDCEESPSGVCTGGWGMRLDVESMAKIGQMMIDGGIWQGKRIISEEWISQMGDVQIEWLIGDKPSDLNQGYGYQMWRCLEPGVIRADGAYGQYIILDRSRRLVVAMNGLSINGNSYKELQCIWHQLIPGVKGSPLKTDKKIEKQLNSRLQSMRLPTLKGSKAHKRLAPISLTFADNETGIRAVALSRLDNGDLQLTVATADGCSNTMPLAYNGWAYGKKSNFVPYSDGYSTYLRPVQAGLTDMPFTSAGNYAMTDADALTAHVAFTDWIAGLTLRFTGIGTENVSVTVNDNFHPERTVTLPTAD